MTRGQKNIAFIEAYCRVPEGKLVGKPLKLLKFQKKFIIDVYDNKVPTSRAYLSIARKNGKTVLIAALVLCHVVGPEARQNSQVISGARSRDQASLVFKAAEKMVRLNPDLEGIIKITPSHKQLTGLLMNVEYRAISAEAGTAHGLSPVVAILDEVGQVKGPLDAFIEAIETAQGAHDDPLLIAISTQAPTDADLFSVWLADAESSGDPTIVSHVYAAPEDCKLDDRKAWAAANPALGKFRSKVDLENFCRRAMRQPSAENSFRWLYLNQMVESETPFVSRSVWQRCGTAPAPIADNEVYGALDLSSVNDLTAKIYVSKANDVWNVHPTFWLPAAGLREKSIADRVPYDIWAKQGDLLTTPGKTVDYEFVAHNLYEDFQRMNIVKVAFDRWNWKHLKPWLARAGFEDEQLDGDHAVFEPMGQGYQSMSPALRELESVLLDQNLAHGDHPVLSMCAANAIVTTDPAGNRKLDKAKARGRIDGLVALAMAMSVAATSELMQTAVSPWDDPEFKMVAA